MMRRTERRIEILNHSDEPHFLEMKTGSLKAPDEWSR